MKHFSKYGLVESDDEDSVDEKDPEKLKLLKEQQQKNLAAQRVKLKQLEQEKRKAAPQMNGLSPDMMEDEHSQEGRDLGPYQNGGTLADHGLDRPMFTSQGLQQHGESIMMQDDSDMPDIMREKMPASPLAMGE